MIALLRRLNQADDLLVNLEADFQAYDKNGIKASLQYARAAQLSASTAAWALNLTRRHMRDLYNSCPGWSWNDRKKKRELLHTDSRFIVAFSDMEQDADEGNPGSSVPLGFINFRFEQEEDEAVLYVYEFQIEDMAQGKGLGKFLLKLVEQVAQRNGLTRVMLTVFHDNKAALKLYEKLGYVLDETSPGADGGPNEYGYDILTKRWNA